MLDGKISVVMPAYNEAHHIVNNLIETVETLYRCGFDFEVILVDDGSPDKTYLEAAKLLTAHPTTVRVVHYAQNQGKGNALICGVMHARGHYVAFLDADMDLHPSQLTTFVGIMEATDADAVIGSKFHPASDVVYPPVRRIYSGIYYMLTRMFFGLPIRDTQTGLKLFRAELLHQVLPRLTVKRYAFDVELLANAHRMGFRLVDAPVTLSFQRITNRVKLKDAFSVLWDTLAVFYRMHILRYYDDHRGGRKSIIHQIEGREITPVRSEQ